ncbi:hypothetical protein DY000_02007203 [Brassica cretica]|uniref:Uncharacterized protein n=1 Tax=Brassica cretica TaxID=69181 RepID=A0ABQ7CF38_BRACR|nr:hypothetical protein DY000_02007203 [Brassica cretica]
MLEQPVCIHEDSGAIRLSYVLAYRRCVSPGILRWRSSSEAYNGSSPVIPVDKFLVSKEAFRHSRIWGNVVRLSVSAIYDEHQKEKIRKRRLFTPLRRDWRGPLHRLMVFLPPHQLVLELHLMMAHW